VPNTFAEASGLNETLCRALHAARLTEEDVAARLEVDPKTVRRWMEGRMPYLRHRWALAAMLGMNETDLWPGLRSARSRPDEVRAIYPHRDTVPRQVWLELFGSAEREIGILDRSAFFLAEDPDILATLDERAKAGVRVRVCLADPDAPDVGHEQGKSGRGVHLATNIRAALTVYAPLRRNATVEIRCHRAVLYNSVYRGDDKFLVSQHAYGIPSGQAAVLYLQGTVQGGMADTYRESFERIWADAHPTS
jgi:transcriptional regulator with XRE-family HTH domain